MPFYKIQDAQTGREIEIGVYIDPHGLEVVGPGGEQIVFNFAQGSLNIYYALEPDRRQHVAAIPVAPDPDQQPARLVLPRLR